MNFPHMNSRDQFFMLFIIVEVTESDLADYYNEKI